MWLPWRTHLLFGAGGQKKSSSHPQAGTVEDFQAWQVAFHLSVSGGVVKKRLPKEKGQKRL